MIRHNTGPEGKHAHVCWNRLGFILASCERNGKTPLVGAGVTPGDCVAESPVTVSHSSSSTGCV